MKLTPHGFGGPVQRCGKTHRGSSGTGAGHHSDGSHGDALVDDGDAVLTADLLAGLHKVFRVPADLVVDLLRGFFHIGIDAVQQGNSHGDGAHIKIFVVDHVDCFQNFVGIQKLRHPFGENVEWLRRTCPAGRMRRPGPLCFLL